LNKTNELVDIHIDFSETTIERNTKSDFDGKMVINAYKRIK
jgi:hypothetical protein